MAKHTITINPFDAASVERAAREVEKIKREFEKKLEIFFDRLAEVGVSTAQSIFGGTTTVSVEKTENGRKVVAQGTDEAYFVEFGTGAYAGSNSAQYIAVPDGIEPGSYSESEKGKHTWSAWIRAGNSQETYPYNSLPQSPMYKAYEAMRLNAAQIAKEVFDA